MVHWLDRVFIREPVAVPFVMATNANQTLPAAVTDQVADLVFVTVTSAVSLGATRDLVFDLNAKSIFAFKNSTTGGQSIRVIGKTGTGITIATGEVRLVRSDGTNVVLAEGVGAGGGGSIAPWTAAADGGGNGELYAPATKTATIRGGGLGGGDGTDGAKLALAGAADAASVINCDGAGASFAIQIDGTERLRCSDNGGTDVTVTGIEVAASDCYVTSGNVIANAGYVGVGSPRAASGLFRASASASVLTILRDDGAIDCKAVGQYNSAGTHVLQYGDYASAQTWISTASNIQFNRAGAPMGEWDATNGLFILSTGGARLNIGDAPGSGATSRAASGYIRGPKGLSIVARNITDTGDANVIAHNAADGSVNVTDTTISYILANPASNIRFRVNNAEYELLYNSNIYYFGITTDGGGAGILALKDATTAPTSNPTGGHLLYSQSGALKGRGSSGTVTTIAAADPHCPTCGRDFALEWANPDFDEELAVCVPCMIKSMRAMGAATSFVIKERLS